MQRHRQGEIAAAFAICNEILTAVPRHFDCLHLAGVAAQQLRDLSLSVGFFDRAVKVDDKVVIVRNNRGVALRELGRFREALIDFHKAISLTRDYAEAHVNLGNTQRDLGQIKEALASFDAAIRLRGDIAAAHYNRGNALRDLGRPEEALTAYDSALHLDGRHLEALRNRALVLRSLRRFEESLSSFDEALALDAGSADGWLGRGGVLIDLDRAEEALASLEQALSLRRDHRETLNNKGVALTKLNKFTEAVAVLEQVLAADQNYAEAWSNLGIALQELRRNAQALESYDKSIALDRSFVAAHLNRGTVLYAMKRLPEALVSYDLALQGDPDLVDAHHNRGVTLTDLGRLNEAITSFERALELKPDYEMLSGALLLTRMRVCDWRNHEQRMSRYLASLADGELMSPWPCLSLVDDPQLQRLTARRFAEAKHPANPVLGPVPQRPPEARIRIGYYSADFHAHATMFLMSEMLENHDRERFEIHGFSFGPPVSDAMRARILPAFDQFIDVNQLSDVEVAALSRELRIDIAVDLKGFTQDSRAGIFAAGCAPVQVNYLGHPGSMGADYIDYMIADNWVIPEQMRSHYTEKVVILPQSYQPNDSRREISARSFTRAELGLPETGFVFCCFNNNFKIHPATFDSWMRILGSVEGSVLWLLADNPFAVENLCREAQSRGVDPTRLIFATRMPLAEHLARHRLADLFLDTLPCNAHTTASDALWAGLPVLTLAGRSFAARVGASLLGTLQLYELITESAAQYEALAISLAGDSARLRAIRDRLERARVESALFDGRLIVRRIETAYMAMIERSQRGLPPDVIDVSA